MSTTLAHTAKLDTMHKPVIPPDETQRLTALHNLLIVDTEPEERFDVITAYAASQFRVPVALVTLIDASRQWFKSRVGVQSRETSRELSFCGHTILGDDIMEVPDIRVDPRFADNPLVLASPEVRFYAGAPLVVAGNHKVGTLCLFGTQPRRLSEWERGHLTDLARVVAMELQGIDGKADFEALRANPPAA